TPDGSSLLNPFDQGDVPDFNVFFFLVMAFNAIYTYMAWQGTQGYNCSARNPHEAKMAKILAGWRFLGTWLVIAVIPLFAYALFNGNQFPESAAAAQSAIDSLGDEGLQRQLTVPLALKEMLPIGIFGLFVSAMLAAAISTDDTYLHSWGSIFIQDVLLPFKKKTLSPEDHLRWLRRSIVGVAIFAWFFGMIFPLYDYIFMYWAITGAIYVGGAGSVIIGGFYWKRATTTGAWAGMITGSVLSVTGVLLINIFWPHILPSLQERFPGSWIESLPKEFWFNGVEVSFYASILAVSAFVIGSLLTKPAPGFSMDRLLHRGAYAIEGEHQVIDRGPRGLWGILGVDSEYTWRDKAVALGIFLWTVFWFTIFVGGTVYGLGNETTEEGWAQYWLFHCAVKIAVGMLTVIWFLWGGFRDL
ncbi:MAG: sodium:solute symporter, partial [Candidatus Omnitrophica bacterium]|nr:sodium:solute symporter [Candidatus Omnitrophota bacterium]